MCKIPELNNPVTLLWEAAMENDQIWFSSRGMHIIYQVLSSLYIEIGSK